jgi:protein-disulfide isomerase
MTPASGTDPDLTRKERREQARSERKAMEAAAAHAARRTRMMQLGGVIAAVIVIVVVIVIATSGGKKEGLATGNQKNSTVSAVTSLVGGIPQSGVVLGNPNAPITLQYFGDLECPICKEFTLGALPPLISKYVRTGKMKIEYHSMETATREQETFRTQQIAALAAGKQNLAWYYIELFYHEQGQEDSGYVTESYLQGLAQQVPGLNLPNWSAARSEPTLAEDVTHDAQTVTQRGFTGTPSFLIGKTGGSLTQLSPESYTEVSAFTPTIEKLLGGK